MCSKKRENAVKLIVYRRVTMFASGLHLGADLVNILTSLHKVYASH